MRLLVAILAVVFLDFASGTPQLPDLNNLLSSAAQTNLFEERCEKNGGAYAFRNFRNIPQQFRNCLILKTNLDVTDQNFAKAASMISLVRDLCIKKTEVHACIYNSAETAQACFDAEDQKSINTSVQILTGASDYVCKNNAEEFLDFSTSLAFACFLKNIVNIGACPESLLISRTQIPPGDAGMDAKLQDMIKLLKFEADDCRNVDEVEQCVAKEMEKCKSHPNADFVTNLFAATKKATPCSGSSRASAIPSVLMFVVTLTLAYLPFA